MKFFKDIREHESLAEHKTRSWLRDLPFYLREDAIPLFVDGDESGDMSEDYQLHPHYTHLKLGKAAKWPHDELCQLSIDDNLLQDPDLVIGIGRLFVNVSNGKAGRTSKWTGYEVFVDKKLALWMVFDIYSLDPGASDWYPQSCRLSHSILHDSGDEQGVISDTSKARCVDIARFLPFLHDLADAEFKSAYEEVQGTSRTFRSGEVKVNHIEKKEVDKFFETEVVS